MSRAAWNCGRSRSARFEPPAPRSRPVSDPRSARLTWKFRRTPALKRPRVRRERAFPRRGRDPLGRACCGSARVGGRRRELRPHDGHVPAQRLPGLKTQRSQRVVPLWPQLAAILKPYTDERVIARGGTLLFPAEDGGMIRDWRGCSTASPSGPGGRRARFARRCSGTLLRGAVADLGRRRVGQHVHGRSRARP